MSESFIDSSLFIKDNSESSESHGTYEKISNLDDVYLIHTDNGSFELYRKDFINTLQVLHRHAHQFVNQLDHEHKHLLNSTIEATRLLHNSKALKELILQDIRSIYHNVKNPMPGTVGAFFIGCFNDDNFKGPLGCNPRCAASLFGCDEGLECADTVLIFAQNQFSSLNAKKTPHCIIYIQNPHFVSFSQHNLNTLRRAGHEQMTLVQADTDGTYKYVTDRLHIDGKIDGMDETTGMWVVIGIIIALIVLLILLGFFYVYNYKI
jgi:hypothetical protein